MRKWLILTSYSVASFLGGAAWATLIVIPEEGTSYYNINEAELTLYSYTFAIISVFFGQVSNWMVAKSLYKSMHFIWLTIIIGCWIRVVAGQNFWISFAGQVVVSFSNMPVLTACSCVAAQWFPSRQLVLATSIGAAANFVGIGFSFIFMSFLPDVPLALITQAIIASVFFFFNLIVGKKDESGGEIIDFKEELIFSLKNKTLMILVVSVSMVLSVNYAVTSIIGILLEQQGFGVFSTGLMGFVITGSGMIGAIFATYLAEVRKSTKSSFRIFMVFTILSSIAFSALLHVDYVNYIVSALFGASITGSLPLGIRACIEFMDDVHESIPTNLIYLCAQVFSSILTYPIQYFFIVSGQSGLWVGSFFVLLSYAYLLYFTRRVQGDGFNKESFFNGKELVENKKAYDDDVTGTRDRFIEESFEIHS
jgi:hypothetical protein